MRACFKRIWRWFGHRFSNVKIWHYCNIDVSVRLDDNVSVGSYTEIGPNVIIGKNTRIGAKCFIPEGVVIAEGCFIGPGVFFSNDMYPPSPRSEWQSTFVGEGARIGAGVCVRPGVHIGHKSLIGMGSVVTLSVPDGETWVGVPARKIETTKREA